MPAKMATKHPPANFAVNQAIVGGGGKRRGRKLRKIGRVKVKRKRKCRGKRIQGKK